MDYVSGNNDNNSSNHNNSNSNNNSSGNNSCSSMVREGQNGFETARFERPRADRSTRAEMASKLLVSALPHPKRLPPGVLSRFQYVPNGAWRIQNVCLQTF